MATVKRKSAPFKRSGKRNDDKPDMRKDEEDGNRNPIVNHAYHAYQRAANGYSRPQDRAFEEADKHGHTVVVRLDIWSVGREPYLYSSFANNAAFITHFAQKCLGAGRVFSRDSFYEILRFYPDPEQRDKFRTRLHFDIEWYAPLPAHTDEGQGSSAANETEWLREAERGREAERAREAERVRVSEARLARILAQIAKVLATFPGFSPRTPTFSVTEGGREKDGEYKYSFHICCTNIYVTTNLDNRIAEKVADALVINDDWENGDGKNVVDLSIYTRNRNFRVVRSPKEAKGICLKAYSFANPPQDPSYLLAFTGRETTVEEEFNATLLFWPREQAEASPDYFLLTGFDLDGRITAFSKGARKLVTYSSARKAAADEGSSHDEASNEAIQFQGAAGGASLPPGVKMSVPEALRELGARLGTFLMTDAYSMKKKWNRPGSIEYQSETEDAYWFTYKFKGIKAHVCAAGVHHNGNSNHRRLLVVNKTNGDIDTRCFRSSTSASACTAWSRVGNISVQNAHDPDAEDYDWEGMDVDEMHQALERAMAKIAKTERDVAEEKKQKRARVAAEGAPLSIVLKTGRRAGK